MVAVATLFGASRVIQAQSKNSPFSGLTQEIAKKFNLKESEVQNVIKSYRQQRLKVRLDQEVSTGKITKDQEAKIINELETLKTKYNTDSLKTMTLSQKQQAFKNMQIDLKSWAQSNGIDLSRIPGLGIGRRSWVHFGVKPRVTPAP